MTMTHYADANGVYLGAFDEMSEKPEGTIVTQPPHGLAIWTGDNWDTSVIFRQGQEAHRQKAFVAEADPLFFQWQAGESTEEEWLAKRQEIRDRYPYPAE